MPGYSATPLPKKLGINAGLRAQLFNAPADVRSELREALAECVVAKLGTALDFAILFSKSSAELNREFLAPLKAAGSGGNVMGQLAEKEFRRSDGCG
jgi:hypothetical protein